MKAYLEEYQNHYLCPFKIGRLHDIDGKYQGRSYGVRKLLSSNVPKDEITPKIKDIIVRESGEASMNTKTINR